MYTHCTYVCTYVHTYVVTYSVCTYIAYVLCAFHLAASVTNITNISVSYINAQNVYNIAVNCTIHPDSTADQCVVMAMTGGRVIGEGNEKLLLLYVSKIRIYHICNNLFNSTA